MGLDNYNYCGIYIETDPIQVEEVDNYYYRCEKCKITGSGHHIEYCSKCGNNVIRDIKKKVYLCDKEEFRKKISDISSEDKNIIKNITESFMIGDKCEKNIFISILGDNNDVVDLSEINIVKEINDFIDKNQNLILIFNEFYKDKYKIKFGVITYYK
jgi:hypothetical protein